MSNVDLRTGAVALKAPDKVRNAEVTASEWKAVGSALTQTQAVQNSGISREQWTGAAADAAAAEIQNWGRSFRPYRKSFLIPRKFWKIG